MKKTSALAALALLIGIARMPAYQLTYPLSPDDSLGKINGYVGLWCYTNMLGSNQWYNFANTSAGITNMTITSQVHSPAYLAVEAVGTNWLLSSPTNIVLYNTNTLAGIFTNVPIAPRSPGTPALTQ